MDSEHFDVLVVGAGISGVGGAYHLTQQCPGKSFVVLEAQDGFGGTWRTHRFPGIRSDSDLYTFGYRFKPWTGAPIATAGKILEYMGEVIEENGLARHIRYGHRIVCASWSSDDRRWTIEAERTETGERARFTAGFLWMCQGYYRHAEGYTPQWPGMDAIRRPHRPSSDLAAGPGARGQAGGGDRLGRDRGDAGSGARGQVRAADAAAALADVLHHRPQRERAGRHAARPRAARAVGARDRAAQDPQGPGRLHAARLARARGGQAGAARRGAQVSGRRTSTSTRTSRPRYRPWRQRVAFIPDGDLFCAIRDGKASVVTDEIESFTETGIRLKSGGTLEADVIVTATGFNLSVLGDIAFTIDGAPLEFARSVTYRGAMFTGIPNLAWVFGYFRASWTLRADLVADFVCRLLGHMERRGAAVVVPALRAQDHDMPLLPWVDAENFNPGYVMRGVHLLPKQGDRMPWRHTQDYWSDKDELPAADLDDGTLVYS